MAISPRPSMSEHPIDFRAPPPSPIATGRRSCFTNEDILTAFLENSLRVPDLTLPDKLFPRQTFIEDPPVVDFQSLDSMETDSVSKILDSLSKIGCFQLVNCGIPPEFVGSVSDAAAGIFNLSPEKKEVLMRSPEKIYGFDESHGEEDNEEFVWGKDEELKLEIEGIWPSGYSNFSEKMGSLVSEIERIAEKILQVLQENSLSKSKNENEGREMGSVCIIHKNSQNITPDKWANSLSCDVIRMLIRGSDYSHALCLHVCNYNKSSEFHVYSKKGWVSFSPQKDATVVTAGDLIQAWSGGQYKHVIGRLMYRDDELDNKTSISMAFLCSPKSTSPVFNNDTEKTISLVQQAIIAVFLTLFYNFLVFIFGKF